MLPKDTLQGLPSLDSLRTICMVILSKEKRLGIAILVAECLAIRKALMIAMKKNLQGIIMEINSQLTVNAIDRKNQF